MFLGNNAKLPKKPYIKEIMQLVISVLSDHHNFINEIFLIVQECKCAVMEIRSSHFVDTTAASLLVQGNWNQIAKLENMLETMQKRVGAKISCVRPSSKEKPKELMPYSLETISFDYENVIIAITAFLVQRNILVEEISGSCFEALYTRALMFSSKFVVLIPVSVHPLSFREELLDFCDQLCIDAVLEPIKR